MDDLTLAYIAGVMDSDGYFTIRRSTYAMRVRKDAGNPVYSEKCGIKQVSPEAIDLIYKLFGGYRKIEKPSSKNGKPLHSLSLTCKKANYFIQAILPYLRIKRRQAEILLELRASIESTRSAHRIVYHADRWGQRRRFRQSIVSPSEIQKREDMIARVKALNDIREFSYLPSR